MGQPIRRGNRLRLNTGTHHATHVEQSCSSAQTDTSAIGISGAAAERWSVHPHAIQIEELQQLSDAAAAETFIIT